MGIFRTIIDFFSNSFDYVYGVPSENFGFLLRLRRRFPPYKNKKNQPIILSLETGVPKYKTLQSDALQYLLSNYKNNNNITYQTIVKNIYKNSRIETRYLGIPDFMENMERAVAEGAGERGNSIGGSRRSSENEESIFFKNTDPIPIQLRLNKFKEIALPLVFDVCSRAINSAINSSNICKNDIRKLIIVSSTGFFGPSLDCNIIKALDLPRTIDRTLIGFMGCAAAINGFRIATDFVNNNPGKCALMVCVEISSVHTNFNDSINDIVTHSIFSDGVSACILRAEKSSRHFFYTKKIKPSLTIIDSFSCLMDDTEDGIKLEITDNGITCKLSKNLPRYINNGISYVVDKFLEKHKLIRNDISFWVIHPGGRRIIEEVQKALGISEEDTKDSWDILKNYGNMLSPSIMFVLEKVIMREKIPGEYGLAISFSPGVGTECLLLQYI